jgi:hypothetical protein
MSQYSIDLEMGDTPTPTPDPNKFVLPDVQDMVVKQ